MIFRRAPSHVTEPSWSADLRRRIALARAALVWEQIWYAAWPLLGIAGLFVALSLLGLWSVLPRWAHIVLGAGFAIGLVGAAIDGARRVRIPRATEAERRIERENGLAHRPLSTLGDHPVTASGDPEANALWRVHQLRAVQAVRRLRLVRPRPRLIRRDPWALRHALILLLVVGWVISGADLTSRLGDGFRLPASASSGQPFEIQAWIRPPAYTGTPPLFLTVLQADRRMVSPRGADGAIWVPAGSELAARLGGGGGVPKLVVRQGRETKTIRFGEPAPGSYAVSRKLDADQTLTVEHNGETVADWPIRVVPDQPPVIAFAASVAQTERFSLAVPYLAEDDYGVTSVCLEIRPRQPGVGVPKDAKFDLPIVLPGTNPRHVQQTSYHDLTAHLWAGQPVALQLVARDAAGQTARSKPVDAVLPERVFRQPLARAIVEQRKALAADPAAMPHVAAVLDALTMEPERFFTDSALFLGLRTVYWRLKRTQPGAVPDEVYATLWSLALRAEEGELSVAERALRDAERRMKDALNRDTKPQDLDALSHQLQRALDRFIDSLAKQSQRQAEENGKQAEPDPDEQQARKQDFHDLIDRANKLAQLGDKDAARELLSQLESMIENMQAGRPGPSPADQARKGALRDLSKMMDQQQDLLDKSFRQSQGNPSQSDRQAGGGPQRPDSQGGGDQSSQTSPTPGGRVPGQMDGGGPGQGAGPNGTTPTDQPQQGAEGQPGGDADGDSAAGQGSGGQQEKLRRQLGDLMKRLDDQNGSIPGPLGHAERSMRDARQALDRGQPGDALEPQRDALDQLQQGADVLSRQMRDGKGQGQAGGISNGLGTDRDPLGRPGPTNGPDYGIGQNVPDAMQIERARRILDEIERRASERSRPGDELDYLDRLLRRF